MSDKQREIALKSMEEWLEHPAELGKKPAKIQCTGEFDLHDMHYYIFKYKKDGGLFEKWLLGVSGGFDDEESEVPNHTLSEFQEYNEKTAEKDAIALVEMVREYWMKKAKEYEDREKRGRFLSFILLENDSWDCKLYKEMLEKCDIVNQCDSDEEENEDTFVINFEGCMLAVSKINSPIPDGEAEFFVKRNNMWKNGVEEVKKHTAQVIISLMAKDEPITKAAVIYSMAVSTACNQDSVIGVYTNGVVYQKPLYLDFAQCMQDNMFPINNLVWIGVYKSKNGMSAYTCGMEELGYLEMEIIDSSMESPYDLHGFLTNIASYVVLENVTLIEGETIGLTAEQRCKITKSKGIAVEGDTLKIAVD